MKNKLVFILTVKLILSKNNIYSSNQFFTAGSKAIEEIFNNQLKENCCTYRPITIPRLAALILLWKMYNFYPEVLNTVDERIEFLIRNGVTPKEMDNKEWYMNKKYEKCPVDLYEELQIKREDFLLKYKKLGTRVYEV